MIENQVLFLPIILFVIMIYYRITINRIQCGHYFKKFINSLKILKFAFKKEFNNMK